MSETSEVKKETEVVESNEISIRPEDIHLPPSSYWPIILALGFSVLVAGLALNIALTITGVVLLLVAIVGWLIEPVHLEEEH